MRLFYVFLFFLFTALCFGQSQEIDSLKSVLKNVPNNKVKTNLLVHLSRAYQNYSLPNLQRYANEAYALAEQIDYENGKAEALTILSVYNAIAGNHNIALEQQLKALQIFERINDRSNIARAFHNTGGIYFYLNEYNNALVYLLRSIAIKKELKDTLT
jgi:tetratricopeptide (TPR) repeat protein